MNKKTNMNVLNLPNLMVFTQSPDFNCEVAEADLINEQ